MGAERQPHFSLYDLANDVTRRTVYAYRHPLSNQEWKQFRSSFAILGDLMARSRTQSLTVNINTITSRKNDRRFVLFSNPHDFLLATQSFTEPKLWKNFGHECQHLNMARELGFTEAMIGYFFYQDRLLTNLQYYTDLGKTPEHMTDDEVRLAYREIALAPDWLSEGDRQAR